MSESGMNQSGDVPADEERTHPQDPAEGAAEDQREQPETVQAHSQDPAEGAEDESATTTGQAD